MTVGGPTWADVAALVRRARFVVVATTHADGAPQAAVVGVAVDEAALVFDTLMTSRKHMNLVHDDRVALVVWEGALTVQLEGRADVPTGAERERAKAAYVEAFPDGRERALQPEITWVRVRPTWIRWSDFGPTPPTIVEITPPSG